MKFSSAVVVVFLSLGFFAAPAAAQPQTATEPVPNVPLIYVSDLQALIASKKPFVLVDVRQPEEFDKGHIDGAILMPLGNVPERYSELPKNKKLVVYCHSGRRSAKAVEFLRAHGYSKAVSLSGGFTAWTAAQPSKLKL